MYPLTELVIKPYTTETMPLVSKQEQLLHNEDKYNVFFLSVNVSPRINQQILSNIVLSKANTERLSLKADHSQFWHLI